MYKISQSVVHLAHGMGVIHSIEEITFGGRTVRCYIVEVPDNGAPKRCFVPVEAASQRLRPVINKAQAEATLRYIAEGESGETDRQTWNMRYRTYMELVHSGDIIQLAKVYVDLSNLKRDTRDLSFGERKLLELTRERLSAELGAAGFALPEG